MTAGTIVLAGGGWLDTAWLRRIFKSSLRRSSGARGRRPRVLVDTSSHVDDVVGCRQSRSISGQLEEAGCDVVCLERPLPPVRAVLKMLEDADGVFFLGGEIGALTHRYRPTGLVRGLRKLLSRGGVVMGTSASAIALCGTMWRHRGYGEGSQQERLNSGLGLVRGIVVAVHAESTDRISRLDALPLPDGMWRVALSEGSALILPLDAAQKPSWKGDILLRRGGGGTPPTLRKMSAATMREVHRTVCDAEEVPGLRRAAC